MTISTKSGRPSGGCEWVHKLSAFLDGDLPEAAESTMRAHVAGCEICRTTLAELDEIVAAARSLGPLTPPPQVWSAIPCEIAGAGVGERAGFRWPLRLTVPQALAAGIALGMLSFGAAWFGLGRGSPAGTTVAAVTAPTAAAVQANLASYDAALAEIREALEREPQDPYLRRHLDATLEARAYLVDTASRLTPAQ